MIAFDSDIFSELYVGTPSVAAKVSVIPREEQCLPIVVVEEVLRGRLAGIRRAETGKSPISLEQAYAKLQASVDILQLFHFLPYTTAADRLFQSWRTSKIRIGTHDLRIAAIAVAHGVTLISRNHTDFDLVPGLHVEYW